MFLAKTRKKYENSAIINVPTPHPTPTTKKYYFSIFSLFLSFAKPLLSEAASFFHLLETHTV
jgi:hypothetical protein